MTKPELIGIASRLETVRQEEGLSQEQFAHRLGISRGAYVNYSKAGREIPSSLIVRLYNEFGIDPFWMVTGSDLSNFNERDRDLIKAASRLSILFGRKIDPLNTGAHFEKINSAVEFALRYLVNDLSEFNANDEKITQYLKGL